MGTVVEFAKGPAAMVAEPGIPDDCQVWCEECIWSALMVDADGGTFSLDDGCAEGCHPVEVIALAAGDLRAGDLCDRCDSLWTGTAWGDGTRDEDGGVGMLDEGCPNDPEWIGRR